jgi:anaerobic ribonucleoside-triphosphate reductase activating protein
MRIGRILSPVHSLGPGERLCIWTQGCGKKCMGCISPELQEPSGLDIDEEILWKLMQQIADKNDCSGLTVSGGDPMEQPDSLLMLLEKARSRFEDVLVYTGFSIEDILKGCAGGAGIKCLDYIDVLIDGRYVKELNTSDCVLRGSSNQKITYLNEKMKPIYEEYMKQGRIVETFAHNQKTIITGILNEVTDYE